MEELIIKERKLKEEIVQVINKSELPAMILKPIFKELLEQINILEQQQYEQAQNIINEKEKKNEKN